MVAERIAEQNPGPARACQRCGVYEARLQHQDESTGCDPSAQRTPETQKERRLYFSFNTRERKLFKNMLTICNEKLAY